MATSCNVRVVSTPFGINGLECYTGDVDVSTPHMLSAPPIIDPIVAGGVRGVRQISLQQENVKSTEKKLIMISLHHRGRLLVWDADSFEVVAMCNHHGCSVVQCVVTQTYLYVRVENEREHTTDAESMVHVWHAKTFELFRQVSAHEGRVTSIVVSEEDDSRFATSGTDHFVHIWNLKKSLTVPVKRITMSGTPMVFLYFNKMILSSSSDTSLVVWCEETGKRLQKQESGSDTISVIRWMQDPKHDAQENNRSRPHFTSLLVGYREGFIKEWAIDTATNAAISFKWANKVHRGGVADVCGDGDVVLSCSTLDGAYILIPPKGDVFQLVSYGCRLVILDSHSKSAIVGVDNGSVNIFSYNDFVEGLGNPFILSSFQPHSSGITGMFLQLREDFTWDRLMCSGADGTLALMDYTKARGGRWLRGLDAHSVDAITDSGVILTPLEAGGGVCLLDPVNAVAFPQVPELQTTDAVTALRWMKNANKLLVGCKNGKLMIFECFFGDLPIPSFHKIEERDISPYFALSFTPSEPNGNLALVCLQKIVLRGEGGFLIVDSNLGDLTFPIHLLPHMYPVRGSIATFSSSESHNYTVILQLRDGSMVQYVGNYVRKMLPIFVRRLVEPIFQDLLQKESTGLSIYPSNYIMNITYTQEGKVNVFIMYAERQMIKQMVFGTQPEFPVEYTVFCGEEPPLIHGNQMHDIEDILTLEPIGLGDLGMAVLRDTSNVYIISKKGEYLYCILHAGSVLDCELIGRRRRSRTFPFDADDMNSSMSLAPSSSPAACTASFCAESHYLAIGYRDGLLQLFDTTQHVVFARFTVHESMVFSLWAFPGLVLSSSGEGVLHAGMVLSRVMFDSSNDSHLLSSEGLSLTRRTSASVSIVKHV